MANLVDTIAQHGRFTTLVSALRSAGLTDTLAGGGPYTVFAPTDDAFDRLAPVTLNTVLGDPGQLRELLECHIIQGRITSEDIKTQRIRSARSLQGDMLTIDVSMLGRVIVNDATVTHADALCDNGVIHTIDRVIIPSGLAGRMAA
jgi:uncharacterized surface protein with fasciclin (FAS1) repeats